MMSLCLAALCACGSSNSDRTEHNSFSFEGEYIIVSANSSVLHNISIQTVEYTTYQPTFFTSAVVHRPYLHTMPK